MTPRIRSLIAIGSFLGLVTCLVAQAADQSLKLVSSSISWTLDRGEEFPPGGQGAVDVGKEGEVEYGVLKYDFASGGAYVAAQTYVSIDAGYSELRFKLRSAAPVVLGVRVIDSSGQAHQYKPSYSQVGQWGIIRIDLKGPAQLYFDGNNNGVIEYPVRQLLILVESRGVTEPGEVFYSDFKLLK